ncbi:MAG: hypothetical protein ACHQVK_01770, partial [Candidatus Paceibacterales bacterium]
MKQVKKIVLFSVATVALPVFLWLMVGVTHADTTATTATAPNATDLAATCQQLSSSNDSCQNLSSADCQAELQKCAAFYDQQSAQIAKDITTTTKQKSTLQNQISTLKKKITGLEAQINQGTLMVKDLTSQIGDTQVSIDKTTVKISDSQSQIANILQTIYQEDQKPSFQILLEGNLADYFSNIVYLESLNSKVSDLLDSTKNLEAYLQNQKSKMDSEKGVLQTTIKTQTLQKLANQANQTQQQNNLKLTEAQYQQQLADKADADQKAAAIKSRIFNLLGVAQAPNFGQAYAIAKYVEGVTGVRAAFTLAVLTQESNLGKNVGQCYLKDTTTGMGVKIKTGVASPKTMSPTRDVPIFLKLVADINTGKGLARDPYATPVSCVIYYNGSPYGWGGAMGPAQFIPSTWTLYGPKVTAVTGKIADPWDITDAFLANGLYLQALGASGSGADAEFN